MSMTLCDRIGTAYDIVFGFFLTLINKTNKFQSALNIILFFSCNMLVYFY